MQEMIKIEVIALVMNACIATKSIRHKLTKKFWSYVSRELATAR